jgi:hypothetical protein
MLMMNCQGSGARVLLLLLCSEATITVPLTAAHQSTLNSANAAEKDLQTEWRQVQYVSIYLSTSHYALKTVHHVYHYCALTLCL